MMLTTLKQFIKDLPDIPFQHFYISYIMKVQDNNIDLEVKFLNANNLLDAYTLETSIVKEFERLNNEIIH